MGIFKSNPQETIKVPHQVMDINSVSRIAKGVVAKGDITFESDVRIDGQMDGTFYSKGRFIVGESAKIKGKMLCSTVDFWGRLDGDIYVRDVLSVKSIAVINGNIHVRKLQVEMGAQINGTCNIISESEFDKAVANFVKIKPEAEDGTKEEDNGSR